jgi:hypothetical protein
MKQCIHVTIILTVYNKSYELKEITVYYYIFWEIAHSGYWYKDILGLGFGKLNIGNLEFRKCRFMNTSGKDPIWKIGIR